MSTAAQYVVSITLFIGIPVAVQWMVSKVTARRNLPTNANTQQPVHQTIRD
jgi:hypothetical protein